jgi:nitrate reductase molybdenum cofactor assembly chaperone NarJ/NarW
MSKTYRALAVLLSYPTVDLQAAAGELRAALDTEAIIHRVDLPDLRSLIDEIATGDLYDLQERYVLLFDRTRSLSLHLFEHIHGESRDRGQAMVDLQQLYAEHGLYLVAKELPDYLPMFLEFLSMLDDVQARELLDQPLHIIVALGERLMKRRSPYAAVFRALENIAEGKPSDEPLRADAPSDDPENLQALDQAWEDAAVSFGPGAASASMSSQDGTVARIRVNPTGSDRGRSGGPSRWRAPRGRCRDRSRRPMC